MTLQNINNYGSVTVDENVIAKIVGLAAMECYGIVGMAAKDKTDGLFQLLKFDKLDKGIKIELIGDNLLIEMHVILEHGLNISTVSQNIIEKVIFNVEKMTNKKVEHVNLYIQGLRFNK